ncbi:MAG: hypothetical protein AABN33_07965 [Acidobacteriota bacterium]
MSANERLEMILGRERAEILSASSDEYNQPGPKTILISILAIAAVLAGTMALRPSITVSRAGKILAFVSLFIFPALAGSMGASEHLERSKKTEFCTSCHVMQDYGKSLFVDDASYLPAVHFQNNRVPRQGVLHVPHRLYDVR